MSTLTHMPPGPVNLFTNKMQARAQDVRASHRQLKDHLGTSGHPTPYPLGKGGVGLHIPKIAMNPMLICIQTNVCRLATTHPLSKRACIGKQPSSTRNPSNPA